MAQNKLTLAQQQTVAAALESLVFLKLVARVQGVGIAKLSKRDLESFVLAADRQPPGQRATTENGDASET
jgi:hypothetical protein